MTDTVMREEDKRGDELLARIRSRVAHPVTIQELMQKLSIPKQDRHRFRRRIRQLVERGELIRAHGNRYRVAEQVSLLDGRLFVNPRGFGFVTPDCQVEPGCEDIFVAGVNLQQAMHGDRVTVRVDRVGGKTEGCIVRVLERASDELVGCYHVDESGTGYVAPFDPRVTTPVRVLSGATGGATPGQMVEVRIEDWPTPTSGPTGRVTEVLGTLEDPGVDTELIIRQYRLPHTHNPSAVTEAERLGAEITAQDVVGRTDFRPLTTVTIDGDTARDFDDAITLETLSNGHQWLGVHIADVAHYVVEGSALDECAYERSTSVYFPERALHMFPEALATGLCSLKPGVDRLVQSCFMELDRRGRVVRYEFHDGVIRSDARMTYTEVDAILTQRDEVARRKHAQFIALLEAMETVYRGLHARRLHRGSIDFDLKASQLVLDEAGMVEDIVVADRNLAHRIIEEFMLVANETVAGYLRDAGGPALFRVHPKPDQTKVEDFDTFARTLGQGLGTPANRVRPWHFQRLLKRLRGRPEERPVALLMLRTMQKAQYDAVNIGHFGLASKTYAHFTSPIRRYPDLIVHRLLRESRTAKLSQQRVEALVDALPEIGRHTSAMERRAEEAERAIVQWKKVRFMADKLGDEYAGYVTGVTGYGLFVELIEHFVEGLVHISTMADDYYRVLDAEHVLLGENTGKRYRLGDMVVVRVMRVDTLRRQVELGLVEILETVVGAGRKHGSNRNQVVPRGRLRGGTGRRRRERRPR